MVAREALDYAAESDSLGLFLMHGAKFADARALAGASDDELRELLDRHAALAEENAAHFRTAENLHARALWQHRAGDVAAALASLERAAQLFEQNDGPCDQARALALRSFMASNPADDWTAACDLARRHGVPEEALRLEGELLRA